MDIRYTLKKKTKSWHMNRIFYIEYYLNRNIHRQRLRRWANENQQIFPEFGFTNTTSDFPTTHAIAYRLENRFDFEAVQRGNEVILRNTNRNFRGFNT